MSSGYVNVHFLSTILISTTILIGITGARTTSLDIDDNSKESSSSSTLRLQQCHEGCLKKVNPYTRIYTHYSHICIYIM